HSRDALDQIRTDGFDAVWVRGILRELVNTSVFPNLASESALNLSKLNALIQRCKASGLDLFLYLNEPLGFSAEDPFWKRFPEARGQPGSSIDDGWEKSYALCTSTEATRQFLLEGSENLFRDAPGLK